MVMIYYKITNYKIQEACPARIFGNGRTCLLLPHRDDQLLQQRY